jgi:hypothetical protein
MTEPNADPAPVLPLAYRAIDDEKRIADSELQSYVRGFRRIGLSLGTGLLLLGVGDWLVNVNRTDVHYLLAWGGAIIMLVVPWAKRRAG